MLTDSCPPSSFYIIFCSLSYSAILSPIRKKHINKYNKND